MKLKSGSYFLMVIMAVALAIVFKAFTFEYSAVRTLPVLIGSIVFLLSLFALLRELRSKKAGEEDETPLRNYWHTGAWIGGFSLMIFAIGFYIAIPLFIISYLKIYGKGWLKGIIIAAITVPLLWVIFEKSLQVKLYRGFLLPWL